MTVREATANTADLSPLTDEELASLREYGLRYAKTEEFAARVLRAAIELRHRRAYGTGPRAMPVAIEVGKRRSLKQDIKLVQKAVADRFSVTVPEMLSQSRDRRFSRPRQVAIYLCLELTSATLSDMATEFRRDYSTVMYARANVESDKLLASEAAALRPWIVMAMDSADTETT